MHCAKYSCGVSQQARAAYGTKHVASLIPGARVASHPWFSANFFDDASRGGAHSVAETFRAAQRGDRGPHRCLYSRRMLLLGVSIRDAC